MRLDPWAGCRSLLLTRGTYHIVERDATRCYCGAITVRLPARGVPLDGLLVSPWVASLNALTADPTRDVTRKYFVER